MPRHPFERLSMPAARAVALSLLAAWLLLTLLLMAALPAGHAAQLTQLLRAADGSAAASMVAAWPVAVRTSAGFVIGFDFLYDLVHDNAVALLGLWAARSLGGARIALAARTIAWTMWLGVLLNLPENLITLHVVREAGVTAWFGVVRVIAAFRFLTLWVGAAFGALVLVAAHRRSRSNSG